ncbi:MAG TPA: thioredoxin family protein [Pirellulales bacterium]|nr:thioredoxin family protein [Pirellulales bacterium]
MKPVLSWGVYAALAALAGAVPAIAADGFRWERDLASAQLEARQSGRLVWIHFGGPWCGPCQFLERNVFSQPGFGRELAADYVAVKIDPRSSPEAKEIAAKYGVERVPFDVIARPSGQLVLPVQSPTTAAAYASIWSNVARQERLDAPPASGPATTPSNPPPQVASQGARGDRLAARPADNRYADYYNGGQGVEREPYQPPVGNRPPQTASQPPVQTASAPADRYADRSANRYQNQSVDPSRPISEDRYSTENRYPPSQDRYAPQPANSSFPSRADAANQAQANADARYGAAAQTQSAAQSQPQQQPSDEPPADEQLANETPSLESKLPPGSPPLALDGYCVVSLFENRKQWQQGDVKWGVIHRGQLYLFVSQEAQQKFMANPDNYCPVCRGHDPVLVLDQNQAVPGRRQYGVFYGERIFLFANESTLEQFSQNPKRYSAEILQAMRQ